LDITKGTYFYSNYNVHYTNTFQIIYTLLLYSDYTFTLLTEPLYIILPTAIPHSVTTPVGLLETSPAVPLGTPGDTEALPDEGLCPHDTSSRDPEKIYLQDLGESVVTKSSDSVTP